MSSPLDLVYADLCRKMSTQALGGSSYFMLIIDNYSRKIWVYFLCDKAQAFNKLKEWLKLVENETKKCRTDGGGYFNSKQEQRDQAPIDNASYTLAKWYCVMQKSYHCGDGKVHVEGQGFT